MRDGPAAPRPAPWQAETASRDGTRIVLRGWIPERPCGAVLVVHGLGEHGGRYAVLAGVLARAGVATFAPDLRGHGESAGPRGHVRRFAELFDDVEAARRAAAARLGAELPWFLLGHSLGGLVVVRLLQTRGAASWAGAILSAPALGLAARTPFWKTAPAALLTHLAPSLSLRSGLDADHLSRDPRVVAEYRADPRVHDRITPRLYAEMARSMRRAWRERARLAQVPLLFLVPGSDRIVRAGAAERLAGALRESGSPVEVRRYAESYHEPLRDLDGERVSADVRAWLASRGAIPPDF